MSGPDFLAMRSDLVERGLLTADFRLTEGGVAHVDGLIADLRDAEAPAEPWKPRVFWNLKCRPSTARPAAPTAQDERERSHA